MHTQLYIVHDRLKYDNTDFRIEELIILALHNRQVEFREKSFILTFVKIDFDGRNDHFQQGSNEK